jgi:hypothetical protein
LINDVFECDIEIDIDIDMMILLLALIAFADGYQFNITKDAYNGSITFDGLVAACKKDNPKWKPCTKVQLYHDSWKQNIPISWFLQFDTPNCLGFTTDSRDAGGSVFSSKLGYIEMVSCEMFFAICCYS